jgi:predicted dehydrogenase
MSCSRRDFLAASAAAGVAFGAPAVHGAEKTKKYRTALIGSGWWGRNNLNAAIEAGESQVVGLCDVDQRQLDAAADAVEKKTGTAPKKHKDFRELLEREKPEIVIVSTPDHWHPLCTIAAVNAGAHVYVEKPISHTIVEGRAMVQAARRNDRVVQVGTHRRLSPHHVSARKFLKEGRLGKIGMVRTFVLEGGGPGSPAPDADPPPGLDWDMWLGPAPYRPFNPRIHPFGWRQFLDYANGTVADWGIHWFDQVRWCMDEQYPTSVHSTGGRHIRKDNTTAPDTQVVHYTFDDFTLVWEQRHYGANGAERHNIGCYFYGTEGMLHLGFRDGWTFYPARKGGQVIHEESQLNAPDDQNIAELWQDFLRSIKTGARPACDIEIGHRSTTMSLLAIVSLKLGRSVRWDGEKELVPGDDEANNLLRRNYRDPWKYPEV